MKLIFEPIRIKNLKLRNRILMPALHMNHTSDGTIGEKIIRFYEERAKGGCGLIMIGGCIVNEDAGGQFMIGAYDDKFLPGMTKLADTLRKHGAASCLQLYHAGRYSYSFILNGRTAPSASETLSPLTKEMSRELSLEEIEKTIQDFAKAALRVKQAGFDMVEVISSAGYLISQFLSPVTNLRTDKYGGSFENRMRFGCEVIKAIVEAVGPDYPISVRLGGNDFVKGSLTNKEICQYAKKLEEAGASLLDVTGGWHETRVPQLTGALPKAGLAYLGRNIRQNVSIPVSMANRIHDDELAERLLSEGWFDMISLGRPLVADPYLPVKLKEGRADEIIRCTSCNQGCLDNVFKLMPVGCLANPEAGDEERVIKPAKEKKRILVAGGGVAGMTAAAYLARRGHSVELFEKGELGGQINVCWRTPHKDEFLTLIASWEAQCKKYGVKIHTGREVDAALVKEFKPEVLVVASGSESVVPPIPGVDKPGVIDALSYLHEMPSLGKNIVVIGAGPVGVEVSQQIASIGTIDGETAAYLTMYDGETPEVVKDLLWHGHKQVTLVEMQSRIGSGIGKSTRWVALQDLQMRGVRSMAETRVLSIEDSVVVVENAKGREELPYDNVILAVGSKPKNNLLEEAAGLCDRIESVGDCKKIEDAYAAIKAGYELGLSI